MAKDYYKVLGVEKGASKAVGCTVLNASFIIQPEVLSANRVRRNPCR